MNRRGRASAKTAVCPKTRSIPPVNKFPRGGQVLPSRRCRKSWRARRDGRRSVIGAYDWSDRNARHSTRRAVEVRWTEVLHHRPLRFGQRPKETRCCLTLCSHTPWMGICQQGQLRACGRGILHAEEIMGLDGPEMSCPSSRMLAEEMRSADLELNKAILKAHYCNVFPLLSDKHVLVAFLSRRLILIVSTVGRGIQHKFSAVKRLDFSSAGLHLLLGMKNISRGRARALHLG